MFKDSAAYRDFSHKSKEKILKYIEAMYTQDSQLNQIMDLEQRKKSACEKAGLNPNDKWVQDMMALKSTDANEKINELIFRFITTQNSNRYIALISNQQLFWKMQHKLMVDYNDDDELKDLDMQTKLSEKSDQLLDRIEEQMKKIFVDKAEIEMAELKIRSMLPAESRVKRSITQ